MEGKTATHVQTKKTIAANTEGILELTLLPGEHTVTLEL
jgi:hypothetical protein